MGNLLVPSKISEWRQLEDRLAEPGQALDGTGLYLLRGKIKVLDKKPLNSAVSYYVVLVSGITGRQSPRFSIYFRFGGSNTASMKEAFRDLPVSLLECVVGISVVRKSEYLTQRVINYLSFPGSFSLVIKNGLVTDYLPV
ncbi:hypothetical protein HYV85_05160 [Candidatus Woesearchaeota archaeon]|nr:hypothetical protein [Candidatus Woesearchaeota archaeon]